MTEMPRANPHVTIRERLHVVGFLLGFSVPFVILLSPVWVWYLGVALIDLFGRLWP